MPEPVRRTAFTRLPRSQWQPLAGIRRAAERAEQAAARRPGEPRRDLLASPPCARCSRRAACRSPAPSTPTGRGRSCRRSRGRSQRASPGRAAPGKRPSPGPPKPPPPKPKPNDPGSSVPLSVPSATVNTRMPALRARAAPCSGVSTPRVCAPSESSTIAPGIFPSLPRGASPTDALTVCTASSRPSPIAVPASGESRSIPSWRIARSVVGITSRFGPVLNETRPIFTPFGTRSANAPIACCAAPSRVGLTSAARIEPETSTSSTTVARFAGTETDAFGRASAVDAAASASRNNASGAQRRHDLRVPATDASRSRFVNATA